MSCSFITTDSVGHETGTSFLEEDARKMQRAMYDIAIVCSVDDRTRLNRLSFGKRGLIRLFNRKPLLILRKWHLSSIIDVLEGLICDKFKHPQHRPLCMSLLRLRSLLQFEDIRRIGVRYSQDADNGSCSLVVFDRDGRRIGRSWFIRAKMEIQKLIHSFVAISSDPVQRQELLVGRHDLMHFMDRQHIVLNVKRKRDFMTAYLDKCLMHRSHDPDLNVDLIQMKNLLNVSDRIERLEVTYSV